ncbi:MAG TPA: DUF4386 family protein [Candidatus Sulfotelmatobacter sp.]|nr:DUF4386 family protein [Candidatus Sulfotelmatobacter sp.]
MRLLTPAEGSIQADGSVTAPNGVPVADLDTPDPSWRGLYLAGGISAVLFVVLNVAAIVILAIIPPAPSSGGAATLQWIASNRTAYTLELILFVAPSVLAMVVFLALYVALKHLSRSLAAIAALVAVASEVIAAAANSSPQSLNAALILLSDQYAAATNDAQRLAFATAAESLIATTNAVNLAGVMLEVGILITSLVMLKGVFPKWVAYLGIATGVVGILSEALRPVIGLGYIVFFVLEMIWLIAVAWRLYRLWARALPELSPSA